MRIGEKLFPYPILNNNLILSDYKETSFFELKIDRGINGEIIEDEKYFVLKNACFNIKNIELNNLYLQGKIKVALIIECPNAVYRKKYNLSHKPVDIKISKNNLNDLVYISAFMYATENIKDYKNEDFSEEYDDYTFEIEKYDILAVDDGIDFKVEKDKINDDKLTSIFSVVRKELLGTQMSYQSTSKKIEIYLSPEYYIRYDNMKHTSKYNNIIFSMIVIPALIGSLYEIKSNIMKYTDINDIVDQKKWFNSVCLRYEKVMNTKLDIEEFQEIDVINLAQIILNDATCNGIKEFHNIIFDSNMFGGEEDE